MSLNFNYASGQGNILQDAKNLASSVVNQFIVRPLGSPNIIGVSGFVFDILDDEEISIDSDITDHYVEANYAVQDHIALRPVRFTLRGFVAEVVDDAPNALASIYSRIKGLESLGGLAPEFNVQDAQFYATVNDTVQKVTNVINQAKSIYQLFGDSSTTDNKQQKVFQYFYNMWKTRQLCQVETPFMVFDNMAIESVRALQSGASRFVSDFNITFKQIIQISSITFSTNIGSLLSQNLGSISSAPLLGSGVFQQVISTPVNLGTDAGTPNNDLGAPFTVTDTLQSTFLQQSNPF